MEEATSTAHAERLTADEGFTLIELLIAIFLFGVVMVAMTGVFIASARSIGDQRLRTSATRVATDHLENLRSLPFDQLEAQGGRTIVTTTEGRTFAIDTVVTAIDAATGGASLLGQVKEIRADVSWASGGATRRATYTTAVASELSETAVRRAIGTVTMFPNPAVTDLTGQPLADVEVTVPLEGFPASTLVLLSWTNADLSPGSQVLTSTNGLNWRGTIRKESLRAAIGGDGRGEIGFTVEAGDLIGLYTLAVQRVAAVPPTITTATIDRNPVVVARPARNRSCADTNQCQNTNDIALSVTVDGLDPAQDSVIVQFQLFDGTFQEAPLRPPSTAGGAWGLTIRQRTTKFLTGTARPFRFSAIRTADGATSAFTLRRDVVST